MVKKPKNEKASETSVSKAPLGRVKAIGSSTLKKANRARNGNTITNHSTGTFFRNTGTDTVYIESASYFTNDLSKIE